MNWVYKVYNNLGANKRQRSSPGLASARSCSCWWSSGAQGRIPVPSSQPLVGASLELSLTKSLLAGQLAGAHGKCSRWGRAENGAKMGSQGREVPALLGKQDGGRGQSRHTLRFLAQREGGWEPSKSRQFLQGLEQTGYKEEQGTASV